MLPFFCSTTCVPFPFTKAPHLWLITQSTLTSNHMKVWHICSFHAITNHSYLRHSYASHRFPARTVSKIATSISKLMKIKRKFKNKLNQYNLMKWHACVFADTVTHLTFHLWPYFCNQDNSNQCALGPEQQGNSVMLHYLTKLGKRNIGETETYCQIKHERYTLKTLLEILSHSACTQTLQPSQHTWDR